MVDLSGRPSTLAPIKNDTDKNDTETLKNTKFETKPILTIDKENRLPGTTTWKITKPANGRIQGYASLDSVNAGGKISFFVSTKNSGTLFNIKIFRLGYYQGKGGRLVRKTSLLTGHAQGWWNPETGKHGLPSKTKPRGFLQLQWHPSYELTVPTNWVSGYYLALLTDSEGFQSYIPFLVRDDTHPHAFLVNSPTTTWEAYNYWGDWAFYGHYDPKRRVLKGRRGYNAAAVVSFDRPYSEDNGAGLTFLEFPTVYWLEKEGYDVSYTTSTALEQSSTQWTPDGFISVAHDEYWSSKMRSNVTHMLNQGVNLAFLGANDMYWKIRFADHNRTMIGYRLAPKKDPLHGTPEATGSWRSLRKPESAVTGAMYAGQPSGNPKWVVSDPTSWLYKGLNVNKGQTVPGIIGWEYDSAINAYTPHKNITILSKSPVIDRIHHRQVRYMTTTIYKAKSGAWVFNAGTIWWGYGLSNPVGYKINKGIAYKVPYHLPPSPIIEGVTRNLLNEFLTPSYNVTS